MHVGIDQMRNGLLGHLSDIPGLEMGNLSSEALCELLLFGNPRFNYITNKLILEATISFILSAKRVECAYENSNSAPSILLVYAAVLF